MHAALDHPGVTRSKDTGPVTVGGYGSQLAPRAARCAEATEARPVTGKWHAWFADRRRDGRRPVTLRGPFARSPRRTINDGRKPETGTRAARQGHPRSPGPPGGTGAATRQSLTRRHTRPGTASPTRGSLEPEQHLVDRLNGMQPACGPLNAAPPASRGAAGTHPRETNHSGRREIPTRSADGEGKLPTGPGGQAFLPEPAGLQPVRTVDAIQEPAPASALSLPKRSHSVGLPACGPARRTGPPPGNEGDRMLGDRGPGFTRRLARTTGVPKPKSARQESGRNRGRGSLQEPGSLPQFPNPLAPVTDHGRPGVLRQLVRCIVADPVSLPALGLGVVPSTVSSDFANLANGPVQVPLPTAGEDELLVQKLG
jgi:hypothetical protein